MEQAPDHFGRVYQAGANVTAITFTVYVTEEMFDTLLIARLLDDKSAQQVASAALEKHLDELRERRDFQLAISLKKHHVIDRERAIAADLERPEDTERREAEVVFPVPGTIYRSVEHWPHPLPVHHAYRGDSGALCVTCAEPEDRPWHRIASMADAPPVGDHRAPDPDQPH